MSKKKETAKKENFFASWRKRFKVSFAELKKVHWPNRQETIAYTGVVLVTVTLVTALIWLVDSGISALFSLLV